MDPRDGYSPVDRRMNDKSPPTRIFISAAEQSADEHAAAFISAFRRRRPDATFVGLAGPAMQAAGCRALADLTTRSAMAHAAVSRVPEALRMLAIFRKHFAREPHDAAVMIDSPALNLPIAKIARKAGVPVLYYIAPQSWAWGWRRWRNQRIRARTTRVACIWPFEEPYFREWGIDAKYVGHPSFDRLLATPADPARVTAFRHDGQPVIAILPGSREHVVREVFPGQLEVARAIAARFRRARFIVTAANGQVNALIQEINAHSRRSVGLTVVAGAADRAAAIAAADLALVASGTVTLEVAFRRTPMIVMYNTNRWLYNLIGRWFITTKHLSIPNILAGEEIVPEFMPYYVNTSAISARALELLCAPGRLDAMRERLRQVIEPIVRPGAADNAAAVLDEMLNAGSIVRPLH